MNGTKKRILLVEDNPGDVLLLVTAFQKSGGGSFELTQATDLELALKRIRDEKFDAILLDLSLPLFLGLEPLARVHKIRPRTPLFVLSGYNDPELSSEAKKMGAQDYIVKNQLDGEALIQKIRSAIDEQVKIPSKESQGESS